MLSIITSKTAEFNEDSPVTNPTVDLTVEEIPEAKELIDDMIKMVQSSGDFGLAANQVGDNRSIFMYRNLRTDQVHVVINPKLIAKSGKYLSQHEGCLSLPQIRCHVRRAKRITVGYLDQKGQPQILRVKNNKLQATIIQHELDHLKGILMTDVAIKTFELRS